jgi:hypothetical protein
MLKTIRFEGPSANYYLKGGEIIQKVTEENKGQSSKYDKIARLLVWLFPSPDGQQLVPNQRTKDPVGNLSRNPEKINDIIEILESSSFNDETKKEKIKDVLNGIIDRMSKNKNAQKKANNDFADLLAESYNEQKLGHRQLNLDNL